jgi:hypothetical protein
MENTRNIYHFILKYILLVNRPSSSYIDPFPHFLLRNIDVFSYNGNLSLVYASLKMFELV